MDVSTWRVYSAEQSIPGGTSCRSIDATRSLVNEVTGSSWWCEHFSDIGKVDVVESHDSAGTVGWARANGSMTGDGYTVGLDLEHARELVVLHELAHVAAPVWNPSEYRRGRRLVEPTRAPSHGPGFTRAMIELVERFATSDERNELADAYRHFEVPSMSFVELCDAREDSHVTAERLVEERAEFEALASATYGNRTMTVPTLTWGDWMRMLRRHSVNPETGRTWSQVALCKRLAPLGTFQPRHVRQLEDAEARPEDTTLLRLGLGMGVLFGLDPVWLRTGLGLVRWDVDVELDDLRTVNPEWVDLVEHLNGLIEARPARWALDLNR